jgi:hypothetical protein
LSSVSSLLCFPPIDFLYLFPLYCVIAAVCGFFISSAHFISRTFISTHNTISALDVAPGNTVVVDLPQKTAWLFACFRVSRKIHFHVCRR